MSVRRAEKETPRERMSPPGTKETLEFFYLKHAETTPIRTNYTLFVVEAKRTRENRCLVAATR